MFTFLSAMLAVVVNAEDEAIIQSSSGNPTTKLFLFLLLAFGGVAYFVYYVNQELSKRDAGKAVSHNFVREREAVVRAGRIRDILCVYLFVSLLCGIVFVSLITILP